MKDWLEALADERRTSKEGYAQAEEQIESESGAFEIELVGDGEGNPLLSPVLVAAGDERGTYHI